MKKLLITTLLLMATVGQVHAVDMEQELYSQLPIEELMEAVPEDAEQFMIGIDPKSNKDFWTSFRVIIGNVLNKNKSILHDLSAMILRVLAVLLFSQFAKIFLPTGRQGIITLAGVLALLTLCITDLNSMISMGSETIRNLSEFSELLLPVMAAAASVSGAVSGGSGIYAVSVFFFNLLVKIGNRLINPAILAYVAIAAAGTVIQGENMKGLCDLIGWSIEKCLKGIVWLFTGILTITGILSGTADAAALKATKSAISIMVPVVGGMISSASEMILHAGSLVRMTIGTWGLLAVISIFLLPFLRLSISWFLFKIAAAIGSILGGDLPDLLSAVSKATGFLLGLLGSCALIVMLSCCCMIKMVQT